MHIRLWACVALASMLIPVVAQANTWNEPWHKTVVMNADTIGLYRVQSIDGNSAVVVLKKHLAGKPTPQQLILTDYYLFTVTSSSSNHWEPWLRPGQDYYLYLKQATPDHWQLPTPSAGSDPVRPDGSVEATYRISIHKASVSQPEYEMTESCIFAAYHEGECQRAEVQKFVDDLTSQPVARISTDATPDEKQRFFDQHAALETAALAGFPIGDRDFDRFLASDFFHVQISALRYAASSKRPDKYAVISTFVCDSSKAAIARIVGVLLLAENDARSERGALVACRANLKSDDVSLVRELMDPRVGTSFPGSLGRAADVLLSRWDSK